MELEKKQKIELAERVWEEFLNRKSINKIAKELNINKSVVSNIINYTLPEFYKNAQETCLDNISNLKTEYNTLKTKLRKIKEEKEELEKDFNNALFVVVITAVIYFIVTGFIIFYFTKFMYAAYYLMYSIVFIPILFLLIFYLKAKNE